MPTEDVGPRVAGIVQHLQGPCVHQWPPDEIALPNAVPQPSREGQIPLAEVPDDPHRRSDPVERREERVQGLSNLAIGVEDDAVAVVHESDRQCEPEFPAAGLVQQASLQSARRTCNSASLMVPFSPSNRRSL